MRSLRIVDGDLDVGPTRTPAMVEGSEKLLQDLALWLQEPLGTGPTTPGFGSQLPGLVGEEDPEAQASVVEAEVLRVLNVYQADQMERLREARDAGLLSHWSRSEILNEIRGVTVQAVAEEGAVVATCSIVTASDLELSVPVAVDETGVAV